MPAAGVGAAGAMVEAAERALAFLRMHQGAPPSTPPAISQYFHTFSSATQLVQEIDSSLAQCMGIIAGRQTPAAATIPVGRI